MRLSVSEMAKLCGVSVRTLHYYEEIGLLHPETAAESGYRWYGAKEIETMQQDRKSTRLNSSHRS